MADQRPAFRFRLPWLPPLPAPRPAIVPRAITPPPLRAPPPQPRELPVPTPTPTPPPPPASQTPTQAPPQTEETLVPTQIPAPAPPQVGEAQTPSSTISAPTSQNAETEGPGQSPATAISPVTSQIAETQTPTQPIDTTQATEQKEESQLPTQATTITPITTATQTIESQSTILSPMTSAATPITAGPPFTPPEQAPTQAPQPQTTRSESQPASPSLATTQLRVPSQPSSPSRATAQPRVPSQPSSPYLTAARTRVPSQPSSPSRTAAPPQVPSQPSSPSPASALPRVPSQLPSPSRTAAPPGVPSQSSSPSHANTQPQISSQTASPSKAPNQTMITSQPVSPSRVTIQSPTLLKPPTPTSTPSSPSRAAPQSQAISLPTTPSRTAPQSPSTPQTASQPQSASRSSPNKPNQQKTVSETLTQSTSPDQGKVKLSPERPQPSYISTKKSLSPPNKEQPNSDERDQKSTEREQKEHDTLGLLDSMNQTSRQPSDESNPPKGSHTPDQMKKGGTSNINSQSEYFLEDLKTEEAKEVKEVMKEINANGKAEQKDHLLHEGVPVSNIQAKEESSLTFPSEQTHEAVGRKEINPTSASNGKETKVTVQPRNKTMVGDPRPKQVTSNMTHIPLHKEIRDDISKLVHKMATEDPKHSINDRPVSVITLAGENRGASMHLGSESSKRGGAVHIHRGYKIKPDESDGTTTNEEESSKENLKDAKGKEDQAREAYVNSNVQGINNSIMFDSSISERNPGVHVIHSRFPKETTKATRKQDLIEKQNGESNMIHAQKLTYQPMVKRRCLRGLFLESSDSDPDDYSKPRRHGCRVGCSKKSKDDKMNAI